MKQKVAIYIRVSTQEQADGGYSIKEQEERLRKYADAHDWVIYDVFSDPGFSGAKLERPALKKLIKAAKQKKVNKILVYKLDRLSRRQRDTLYLIEDVFLPNDIDFVSMTENFDTGSPLGRAMIGILSVFAQLEREQIKERMQLGLEARAKDGYFHGGGYAPIGYDYVDGELFVNEYEKMQIRLICDLYNGGMGASAIAEFLNNKGYTNQHGKWHETAVRSCLFTPLYKGVIVWKGEEYPGRHEAIFTEEEFKKIAETRKMRLASNPHLTALPFKHNSLLGGMIYCGNCGAKYYVKQNTVKRHKGTDPKKKGLRYYTCYSRGKTSRRLIKDPNCKNRTYRVDVLDDIVLSEVRKLAVDTEYLQNLLSEDKTVKTDNSETILKRIEVIDKQINKLIDLYQISSIDFNIINGKIESLSEEKLKLEEELSNESIVEDSEMSFEEAVEIIETIPQVLDNGSPEEIKSVVHSLINSIIIYDDAIEIHWKFV